MPDTHEPEDVRITQDLRDKLYDFADVTFSIATDAPDDRLTPAIRDIWDALWDVGSTTPLPTGDIPTPSYVSDPISISRGTWKITVDFGHAPREERSRAPEVIAAVLRRHAATPAVLDATHLTEEEYDLTKEEPEPAVEGVDPASQQPRLFRRRSV
ncbi:hypothetical protein [Streptomyces sp. 7N604]|uniref:hypothetical protein n=1 Tax=Streptomyces sp. 7N604 TaxID=3457415 RepID=UPI003FD019EF